MKTIPLRNRRSEVVAYALVDDDDFESLSQWRWHRTRRSPRHRYHAARSEHVAWDNATRTQTVRSVTMHRQIMGFPGCGVDHRDGNPLNNRRSNLRLATQGQNGQNLHRRVQTKTNIRGVTPSKGGYLARAQCADARLCKWFPTIEEARACVVAWRRENMPYATT